jgi:diguanylate cyclase (GGDEF)-like protein
LASAVPAVDDEQSAGLDLLRRTKDDTPVPTMSVLKARYQAQLAEHERACERLDRRRNNVGGRRAKEGWYPYPDPPRPPGVCLVVIYGAQLGRRFVIEGRRLTIGRAAESDICVPQDSVSRMHATIAISDTHVTITDESRHGTYVNDRRIHEANLKDGDLVHIGSWIFKLLTSDIESRYYEECYRLSTIDGQTEVFNKRHFTRALDHELSWARSRGQPLSLVMLDVDHFARCNDAHGDRAGDRALRELATLVRDRSRDVDVVARYRGEAFAVLLPGMEISTAASFADTIREAVQQTPTEFEGHSIQLTVSVGVAELTPGITSADELV